MEGRPRGIGLDGRGAEELEGNIVAARPASPRPDPPLAEGAESRSAEERARAPGPGPLVSRGRIEFLDIW
ncbi:MAG: hypothetical protein MI919_26370, partial [Holophagales bacterium]|nr:hypothetical protein [Holophagales bacterium]